MATAADISVVVVSGEAIHEVSLSAAKNFVGKGYSGVFVSLLHTGDRVVAGAKRKKVNVDDWLVIDIGEHSNSPNVISIGSGAALTELSLAISQAVENLHPPVAVVFEGVGVLSIYNSQNTVQRFVQFLINKLRVWKVPCVFVTDKNDERLTSFLIEQADNVKRSV